MELVKLVINEGPEVPFEFKVWIGLFPFKDHNVHNSTVLHAKKMFWDIVLIIWESTKPSLRSKMTSFYQNMEALNITVGSNMYKTLKKNAHISQIYFWYLWVFLSWQVKKILWLFGHQVVPSSLLLKIGSLSWNFFWWILLGKKLPLEYFGSIFCPKTGLKCPKTRLFYCAFSYEMSECFWTF